MLGRIIGILALVSISGVGGYYIHAAVNKPAPTAFRPSGAAPSAAVSALESAGSQTVNLQTAVLTPSAEATPLQMASLPTAALNEQPGAVAAGAIAAATIDPYIGKVFKRGPATSKLIALTFDDGPYPNTTPQLLEILKTKGVKATFFMLGQSVDNSPAVARMVADAGHEIGCHTYRHPDLRSMGAEAMREELDHSMTVIEQATGHRANLLRPPYGNVNTSVQKISGELGMVLVNWSIDPTDWNIKVSAETIHAKAIKQAHGGGIVCMHDTRGNTIRAIGGIIDELKAKGYRFVTVSEMIDEHAKSGALPGEADGGVVADPGPDMSQPLVIPLEDTAVSKQI